MWNRNCATVYGFLIMLLSYSLCNGVELSDKAFLGQERPGLTPEIFAPGIVSIPGRFEQSIAFTPDGLECCIGLSNAGWTIAKMEYMQYIEGQWSTSSPAYFTTGEVDTDGYFSPDGLKFFFCSPGTDYFDIWISQRGSIQDRWSPPTVIPDLVPVRNSGEFSPSVTMDGTLYFTCSAPVDGYGLNDICRSAYIDGRYGAVETIGPPVNNGLSQESSFIAPDESYLLLVTNSQPHCGSADICISFRNENDTWTVPRNLGPKINTEIGDGKPYVSSDDKLFFFTRRSQSECDIYWVNAAAFLPDPNGPIHNQTTGQRFGSVQCAINYADTGDTLVLQPGLYQEYLILDKDLTIQSLDPNDPFYVGATIIQGDPNEPVVILSSNTTACTLAGLTIRAGSIGISGTATNATVRNCRIMDNITNGIELSEQSSPHLLNCLITANGKTGIKMLPGLGRGSLSCKPVIENCFIIDNGDAAIEGGEPIIIDSIID